MTKQKEIIFMQVRLIRLASEEWKISIQKANAIFDKFGILKFIKDCYELFNTEGDRAVLNEIEKVLKNKGVDVHSEIG